MDTTQLIGLELEQIRAALHLLAGAVERLAATVEYRESQSSPVKAVPSTPMPDVLQFPKPPAPPRKPMGFVDDNVPIDEDLRFRVMSFADLDERPQL
jgi:hypothetical protein